MARKQVERLLSEAVRIADQLSEIDDAQSPAAISELLAIGGHEQESLRKSLHAQLSAMAVKLRRSGQLVPPYLSRAIDSVSELDVLFARDPLSAAARLRKSLRQLADNAAQVVSVPEATFRIAHAYRKSGELTPEDSRLLEEMESELKSRMTRRGTEDSDERQGE